MTATEETTSSEPKRSRTAFDFSRATAFSCDPITELCIVGGRGVLDSEESGELDTKEDKAHALYDERVRDKLDEMEIANIDAYGVLQAVTIVKIDGVACVVDGRRRVRMARIVNRRRKKRGDAPLSVPAMVRRSDEKSMLGEMISANEIRADDTPSVKIAKMKRYMARGVSVENAAVAFGIPVGTAKSWIKYDDEAIPAIKKAVESGKMEITAGVDLAKIKDPDVQAKALGDLLDGKGASSGGRSKKVSVRAARKISKKLRRPDSAELLSKRDLKTLLEFIKAKSHPSSTSEKTFAWWEGAEEALRFVLGGADGEKVAERLVTAMANAREAKEAK